MKINHNCPIVICAFNRPAYLRRCLESVFRMSHISGVPVYLFCDGGAGDGLTENLEIANQYPFTKIVTQETNLGIAKHMHYIRSTVFETWGAERMMFLEEDVVVSSHYYSFMNRALDIITQHDSSVVMVNSSTLCFEPLTVKLTRRREFGDLLPHLNNYVVDKKMWFAIKPTMTEYLQCFIESLSDYRCRDHSAIKEWAREKLRTSDSNQAKHPLTNEKLTSSQDSITNLAMRINDLRYLSSAVNRILCIGAEGVHFSPVHFVKFNFDKVILDEIPEDAEEIDYLENVGEGKVYRI